MHLLLYLIGFGLVKFLQALPLPWVARLGRAGGAVFYLLDARHRRVARQNLLRCLGQELSPDEIGRLAKENFRRLGENYSCAIKTAGMSWEELKPFVEFVGIEQVTPERSDQAPRSLVVAIGHFGNFELYARFGQAMPPFQCGTTYRGVRPDSLNKLLLGLRVQSGCAYFDRRTDAAALKAWMNSTGRALGLLADQHAGSGGVRLPFFGQECSTTTSPAVFALRYNCALRTGICYRVGLGRWQIHLGEEIPTRVDGKARPIKAITQDINLAFEAAVRRDPANWFWVHNRWKPERPKKIPARLAPPPSIETTAPR